MPYVERGESGEVKGLHRWPQPGYAEEFLADDHPDVVTFRTPRAPTSWTPLEFMERFTKAERATIRAAAKQSDDLADWLDLLRASTLVKQDDPRTQAGMDDLVAAGLVAQERRDEILAR